MSYRIRGKGKLQPPDLKLGTFVRRKRYWGCIPSLVIRQRVEEIGVRGGLKIKEEVDARDHALD